MYALITSQPDVREPGAIPQTGSKFLYTTQKRRRLEVRCQVASGTARNGVHVHLRVEDLRIPGPRSLGNSGSADAVDYLLAQPANTRRVGRLCEYCEGTRESVSEQAGIDLITWKPLISVTENTPI